MDASISHVICLYFGLVLLTSSVSGHYVYSRARSYHTRFVYTSQPVVTTSSTLTYIWPSGKLPFEFSKKLTKFVIFPQNCYWQFFLKNLQFCRFKKKRKFLSIKNQVFGNFLTLKSQYPEGQLRNKGDRMVYHIWTQSDSDGRNGTNPILFTSPRQNIRNLPLDSSHLVPIWPTLDTNLTSLNVRKQKNFPG